MRTDSLRGKTPGRPHLGNAPTLARRHQSARPGFSIQHIFISHQTPSGIELFSSLSSMSTIGGAGDVGGWRLCGYG